MIEGHGDDSYKYLHPIRSNFSSNVYNKVNLDGLRTHLCGRISAISAYPEPEPYTLEARLADRHALPAASVCVTNGATEAIYLIAQTFRGTNTLNGGWNLSAYFRCAYFEKDIIFLYGITYLYRP